MDTFTFCPNGTVPETLPREPLQAMSLNGWTFTARPTTPFQRKFRVKLHGLKWFLSANNTYDELQHYSINARALELFYQDHETWAPFYWNHPHLGRLTCRFAAPVLVPAGTPNASGLLADPLEITLIEHDPGYPNGVA